MRAATEPVDLVAVCLDERPDRARGGGRRARDRDHTFEEELEPLFPRALRSDTLEVVVVGVPMLLEVEAQVQQRLREHLVGAEQQRDQEPTDAAVAVEKRMDRLELDVSERGLDEDRRRAVEE